MTQYMMSVHHTEGDAMPSDEVMQQMFADVDAFNTKLQEEGAWVFAGGLQHIDATTTVDATGGGEPVLTDGPYAESKEWMGGFWVIEAADLDAALEWAGKAATACEGPVEVRPAEG